MNSAGEDILFKTKTGLLLPGFPAKSLLAMRESSSAHYGILPIQVVEAASYSLAMVVRHALGLSADGGKVTALVSDSLCGWVALATLRHLVNAGASGHIFKFLNGAPSAELERQLKPLIVSGVDCHDCNSNKLSSTALDLFSISHNIICGLFDLTTPVNSSFSALNKILNDLPTPVHSIECPIGVDPDSGAKHGEPLYASSTLSLGAPLAGLFSGADFVGRHYLCDISITKDLYLKEGFDLSPLFAEQPVLQILPAATQSSDGES